MTNISESVNSIFIYEIYLLLKILKNVVFRYCTQILTNLVMAACCDTKRMFFVCLPVTSFHLSKPKKETSSNFNIIYK